MFYFIIIIYITSREVCIHRLAVSNRPDPNHNVYEIQNSVQFIVLWVILKVLLFLFKVKFIYTI